VGRTGRVECWRRSPKKEIIHARLETNTGEEQDRYHHIFIISREYFTNIMLPAFDLIRNDETNWIFAGNQSRDPR
jgi:hypothetical protein